MPTKRVAGIGFSMLFSLLEFPSSRKSFTARRPRFRGRALRSPGAFSVESRSLDEKSRGSVKESLIRGHWLPVPQEAFRRNFCQFFQLNELIRAMERGVLRKGEDLSLFEHLDDGEVSTLSYEGLQTHEQLTEMQVDAFGEPGDSSSHEFQQNGDIQAEKEILDAEALVEQLQEVGVSEPVHSRVKVAVTFSPLLFLGEDLYQQKRIRSMIYRYDDSYFVPLEVEDLSLDMIVLVVDEDGVDFQRAIVSEIRRAGISVDRLDYFGIKEVSTVYECPEEIQEESPAVRKYSLKAAPLIKPLLRGRRLTLICDASDRDFLEAELVE